jgi:DNA replication protein DnaC
VKLIGEFKVPDLVATPEQAERLRRAAREERFDNSVTVRGRLPEFVRNRPLQELAKRVAGAKVTGARPDAGKRLLEAARGWRWGSPSLLLLGPTKVGKSTVAAMLFRALVGRGIEEGGDDWERAQAMRWFGAEDLATARRQHPLGKGEAPDVEDACMATLLFIDDAGWDKDPAVVSEILDARYERMQPTVLTSGKTRHELTDHYGAAVVRRLIESGGKRATVVEVFA